MDLFWVEPEYEAATVEEYNYRRAPRLTTGCSTVWCASVLNQQRVPVEARAADSCEAARDQPLLTNTTNSPAGVMKG